MAGLPFVRSDWQPKEGFALGDAMPMGQAQMPTQQKKKKNFWLDQISTVTGTIGALGGGALGALGGGIGAIPGVAAGGAVGSGLGEALENKLMGEALGNNVAKEAALGGLFSVGPLKAGKAVIQGVAPKAVSRAGKSLEESGSKLLASQANLTRAQARKLGVNPQTTLGSLNKRTGLSSLDDMAAVGENVTGKNGVLAELNRNALGNAPGVDISDIRTIATDLFADKAPLVAEPAKKRVLEQVKNSATKAYGGSKGSLDTLANPMEAFDVARGFEAQASLLRTGATVSPADKQLASVYSSLAKEIKDRLYAAPGVQEGLDLARPAAETAFKQLAAGAASKGERRAYERLAGELPSLNNIGAVRGAQKDFVDIAGIDRASAEASLGAAQRLGDNMQGLGRLVQRPTNLLAVPLDAATPRVGGALASAGRAIQAPVTAPGAGGIAARMGGLGVLTGGGEQATQEMDPLAGMGQPTQPTLEDTLMGGGMGMGTQQPEEPAGIPQENLIAAIAADAQETGGKNIGTILTLYKTLNDEIAPKQKPLSAGQQSQAVRAQNALNDISTLQDAIQSGSMSKTMVPGSGTALGGNLLGTTDIEAALFNIGDVILRNRTGAQAPASEVKKFVSGFLPRGGESKEAQMNKLERAVRELSGMMNPAGALGQEPGGSLEDLLMAQGGY